MTQTTQTTQTTEREVPANASGDMRATYVALAALPIKGRAPKTGYDRALFGQAWTDDVTVEAGHNGCDTRNDILRRDLTSVVIKLNSSGCVVQTGVLGDPYTGKTINFERGSGTSTAVDIDHVVALSDAWQKGAQQWDAATRKNFANDPRNLLAVDGPTNLQKSDGDAATWLPPNKSFRCTMVTMQVRVKAAYGLWVTEAEHDAIKRELDRCDGLFLPGPVPGIVREREPQTTTTTTTTVAPPLPPTTVELVPPVQQPAPEPAPSAVYYKNCTAARAAGAAPIYSGQPGYRSALDRDGDGIACE